MGFDLRRFLRRTPGDCLKLYFADRCAAAATSIDWGKPQTKIVDALIKMIEGVDSESRAQIWSDFERVGQFDDEYGRKALRSVISENDGATAEFDALEGNNACGLYVLLTDPPSFDNALAVHYATRLSNGRDWSGLEFLGDGPVAVAEGKKALSAFADQLSVPFYSEGGGRGRLKVESFARRSQDPADDSPRKLVQYTIYIEQPPESTMVFERNGEIARYATHPVTEAAIVFDEAARSLDIVSKGGKQLRHAIAEAFVATMVSGEAAIETRPRRKLNLERLKTRLAFDLLPEDRVRRVEVESLRLAAPAAGGGLVTIDRKAPGDRASEDIYDCALRWFGRHGPPDREGWRVLAAKLRVVFEPEREGLREKRVLVELKAPDRSNLRDQTEKHRLVSETLLARWGLYSDA